MNNFDGNYELREAAQHVLNGEQMDADSGIYNGVFTNTDLNNGALPGQTEFGGLQFSVNNILTNNSPTGTFGTASLQNGTLPEIMANNPQARPPGAPLMQNEPFGALPGFPPELIAQILGAYNIQAMLSLYAAAPRLSPMPAAQGFGASFFPTSGFPTPSSLTTVSSSMTNSSASSLASSASASPGAPGNPPNVPCGNGLWNNVPTTWLNRTLIQGTSGMLSSVPATMTASAASSLMNSANVSPDLPRYHPIAPNLNDPILNGVFSWNHSQLSLMNSDASVDIDGQLPGTPLTSDSPFGTTPPTVKKPRTRRKQKQVRNAVDQYRRARRTLMKNRKHVAAIAIGTLEYDKKLEEAKKHYQGSDVNNDEYLKSILHFLSPHLINPFADPQEDFPRKKNLITPTPAKLYRKWMECTGSTGKKFYEVEEEKGEEHAKWCKLAEMIQQEALVQIAEGFITGAIPERRSHF